MSERTFETISCWRAWCAECPDEGSITVFLAGNADERDAKLAAVEIMGGMPEEAAVDRLWYTFGRDADREIIIEPGGDRKLTAPERHLLEEVRRLWEIEGDAA